MDEHKERGESASADDNELEGVEKPLTDWKNPPTIKDLKQNLTDAGPHHSSCVAKIDTWLDNLNVEGKAKVKTAKGSQEIVPKLIRKQAEWRYASLTEPFLSTDDVFNVRPVTWEDRDAARQNELLLNNQLNTKLDKVKFIDEYVRTAVDEGTVILQVGWCFEEAEVEEEKLVVEFRPNPALAEMHQFLDQLKQESPSQWMTDVPQEMKEAHEKSMQDGIPYEPVVTGKTKVKVMKTVKNHPTIEVCDYRYVVIDPTAMGDVEKAQFISKGFESSLSELRKEPNKYKNLDAIPKQGDAVLGATDSQIASATSIGSFRFEDQPRKKLWVQEYWGYWDIDGSGIVEPFVAAWVGNTLIRMEASPFPDKKLPFVVEQYLPVRRENYGEPDGALLEDNQRVMGAVTRGMIDLMGKSANGQTGMRKDMLDATNKRKFLLGQDYEFNATVDPRVGVHMHTYPEIPQSAQFMLQLQTMEAESMTGVKSFSQGVSGQSLGDVAAGVRGALDAASKRELGILRRLSNGLVKAGRKIISMNAEFLEEEEVVRVTNEEFVKVRKDDLGGEFDLRLSISTAEEDHNKAQELAFMFQTAGPNMDPAFSQMILSDIARLRKMPDLAEKIEKYKPQPDPILQEKAKLEVELLRAQIASENAKAMSLQSGAGLHAAKANTEQVKQGHLQSDTDQKNLDFVEQESGVKQERDLQLHQAQAAAQSVMQQKDHQVQREKIQADVLKEFMKGKAKKKE